MKVHAHWGVALVLSFAAGCSDSEVSGPPAIETVVAALSVPAHISVFSGSDQSAAVDGAFASQLVVKVTDAEDNPVVGAIVHFGGDDATTASIVAPPEPTADDGTTRVAVIAGTRAWSYDLSAWVDGVDETAIFHLTNVPGPAARIVATSGGGQSAVVDQAFAAPLVAHVMDVHDNPIAGALVTWSGDSATTAVLSGVTDPTDDDGATAIGVTAGTFASDYQIVATVAGVEDGATFALTNTHGPAAAIEASAGDLQAATVDQAFAEALVVRVADVHDNPVPDAIVTLAGESAEGVVFADQPAATDANGFTSFGVIAGTEAGAHDISAAVDGVEPVSFHLFTLAGPAAHLYAESGADQRATVDAPFLRPLVARVTDRHGNAVHGATVTFDGAAAERVVFGDAPGSTDVNGLTRLDVVAGTRAGSYLVTASMPGSDTQVSWALSNAAGPAAHLELVSGNRQTAIVNSEFAAPLVVAVTDVYDNPVPDAVVSFSGGHPERAGFFAPPEPTDEDGKTSVRVIAGTKVDGYALSASLGGVADTVSFELDNVAGPAARLEIVSGDAQTAMPGEDLALPLVVRLVDAWGNAIAGAQVGFATPVGGAGATLTDAAPTDAQGRTSVAATAGAIAGTYTITASAAGVTPVTFHQTTIVGVPAMLEVVSGDAQIAVVGQPFGVPLVVRVRDAHGNPLAGVPVELAAPASGAGASLSAAELVSDADGRVEARAEASRVAGNYAIRASVPGVGPVELHLVNAPTPVARLVAGAESVEQAARVGTPFAQPLEVVAYDAFDNPIAGLALVFAVPAMAPSAALDQQVVVTDEDGAAWVHATALSEAGTYHVRVSVADDARIQTSFALSNLPGAPVEVIAVSGTPASAIAGRAFAAPLVVRVSDAEGNPVPAARVVFTGPSAEPTAQLSVTTVYSDADGRAQVGVRAGQRAGRYTVRATVEGAASPAVFDLANVAGAPSLLVVTPSGTPQSTRVGTSFDQRLEVGVADELGNPVPAIEVHWMSPTDGPGASLSDDTTATGDDGAASVHARASEVAGPYEVIAAVDGLEPVRFALTNVAAEPATLGLWGGGSQSVAVGHTFPSALGVALRDRFGNPIGGATIRFAVPAEGASAVVPETVVTDPLGKAYASARANDIAGIYQVVASAEGVALPVVFGLVNKPGPARHVVAISEASPQASEAGASFPKRLGVDVSDEHGNPVSGVTVVFAAPATHPTATLSSVTALSDASGRAEIAAIAGPVVGAYEVTASIVGVEDKAVFALENLARPGLELGLVSGAGQFAIATTGFHAPITLTVKDHLGRALAGVPVTLTPEGDVDVPVPSTTSDADGHAVFLVTAGRTLGPVSVVARAEGALSAVVVHLAVEGIPTDTWLEAPAEVEAGTPITLTAHVDAIVGHADGVVRFFDGEQALGMRPVVDGVASLEVVPDDAGRHDFEVIFIATSPFEDSRSEVEPTDVLVNELDFGAGGGGGCAAGGGDLVIVGLLGFGLVLVTALRRRRAAARQGD